MASGAAAGIKSQRRATTTKQKKNGESVSAATISTPTQSFPRLLRPAARNNWRMLPQLSAITPQFLEGILRGALAGYHLQQWELFDLMLDTWPELATCVQELSYGVQRKQPIFEAFHEEDQEPTPDSLGRLDTISAVLRQMLPNPASDDNDLRGTVSDLTDGWLRGVTVLEILWQYNQDVGAWGPVGTGWVHPKDYAFGADGVLGLRADSPGKTGGYFMNMAMQPLPANIQPFPPNRFLVAIHKAKSGPALGSAMLRPLAWWWCAANFASDWCLNLAQIFGLPFRWANYEGNAPQSTIDAICTMLQNMGSAGWAAFPIGTTLELKDPARGGIDHSPQGELLDRADRYARSLILGQTMTGTHGTTGKGGGQAFGMIERDVKEDRIDAAGKFVANVINNQLIKPILRINYGDDKEAPMIRFLEDEEGDLTSAQRDKLLIDEGLPMGVDFIRKKYGIPAPASDEELMKPAAPKPAFGGAPGGEPKPPGGEPSSATPPEQPTPPEKPTPPEQPTPASARLARIFAIESDDIFAKELGKLAEEIKTNATH